MPISKQQARDIAEAYLQLSHALGRYRFDNFATLKPAVRQRIEDAEWDLLGASGTITTKAVGIALHDMQDDLKAIADGTARARKAIETIQTVKDVMEVTAAAVVLGGAIVAQNPGAIASAAADLFSISKKAIEKHKKKES